MLTAIVKMAIMMMVKMLLVLNARISVKNAQQVLQIVPNVQKIEKLHLLANAKLDIKLMISQEHVKPAILSVQLARLN